MSDSEQLYCGDCGEPVVDSWEGDDCPGCGTELTSDPSEKRYVLECEYCSERFHSDYRTINALRATIHAYRRHRERLTEDYGHE